MGAAKDLPVLSTEMGTTTDEKNQSSPEEKPPSNESEKAAVNRDDAVDLSLKEHAYEVTQDSVTNPVEQAKKRARTKTQEGSFLVNDESSLPSRTIEATF